MNYNAIAKSALTQTSKEFWDYFKQNFDNKSTFENLFKTFAGYCTFLEKLLDHGIILHNEYFKNVRKNVFNDLVRDFEKQKIFWALHIASYYTIRTKEFYNKILEIQKEFTLADNYEKFCQRIKNFSIDYYNNYLKTKGRKND